MDSMASFHLPTCRSGLLYFFEWRCVVLLSGRFDYDSEQKAMRAAVDFMRAGKDPYILT
jgi:hypothetical protein